MHGGKIAINAVMAGADPAAMPLIITAIEAMARPEFNLAALNATTGSVVPAVVINGPVRDELRIPTRSAARAARAARAAVLPRSAVRSAWSCGTWPARRPG